MQAVFASYDDLDADAFTSAVAKYDRISRCVSLIQMRLDSEIVVGPDVSFLLPSWSDNMK